MSVKLRKRDVCRLCLQTADLEDSHLLPRALYRLMRRASGNANPIYLDTSRRLNVQNQIHDYLLCGPCEDLMNQQGEKWVLEHCARGKHSFKLLDLLNATQPLYRDDRLALHNGLKVLDGASAQQLIHFPSGVFWKAAVHNWQFLGGPLRTALGPYADQFRLFLLGRRSFPSDAVLFISIWPNAFPNAAITFPSVDKTRNRTYRQHMFVIPGIRFELLVGRVIPKEIRDVCFVKSSQHFIASGESINESVVGNLAYTYGKYLSSKSRLGRGGFFTGSVPDSSPAS